MYQVYILLIPNFPVFICVTFVFIMCLCIFDAKLIAQILPQAQP